jgi:hypothetical protein
MGIYEVGVSFDIPNRTLGFYAFSSKNRLVYTDKNIKTIMNFLFRLDDNVKYHWPEDYLPIRKFIERCSLKKTLQIGSGYDVNVELFWCEMWDELKKSHRNRYA